MNAVQQQIDYYKAKVSAAVNHATEIIEGYAFWVDPWDTSPDVSDEYLDDSFERWGVELGPWRVQYRDDNLLSMHFKCVPAGTSFEHHYHECDEEMAITSGECIVRYRNGEWAVKSARTGEAIKIPSGHLHYTHWPEDTEMILSWRK